MIDGNAIIQEFIGKNWIAVSMFLLILKGVGRQFGIKPLHSLYLILQNAFAIVRPGTSSDSLAKVEEKENH